MCGGDRREWEKEKRGETCEGSERTGDKDKRKEMEGKGWVAWPEQCFLERQRQEGQEGREGKREDP